MTILLVVISLVAGIALGQWFKILILVPVMSLALVGTIAAGIARADNVWSIALMAIAVVTALQIGYLIGIWLRSFIVAARFARPTPASEATRLDSCTWQLISVTEDAISSVAEATACTLPEACSDADATAAESC